MMRRGSLMNQSPYYRPSQKTPEQKKQDLFIVLLILAGVVFLTVWVASHSRSTAPEYTYTVVTPDDANDTYTSRSGSSTSWVYGHGTPLTMPPTATLHYGVNHNPWGYDF